MVNEVGSSDVEDPLHNYSTSSLFSRTIRVSTNLHQNASNDASNIDSSCPKSPSRIDYLHSYLKSTALRIPKKLLEQVKAVLDLGSKLMNLNFTSIVQSEEENKKGDVAAEAEKDEGNLPKSVRFDSKADLSQIMESSEPSLDMDKVAMKIEKLQDTEGYFFAHKTLKINQVRSQLKILQWMDDLKIQMLAQSSTLRGRTKCIDLSDTPVIHSAQDEEASG